MKPIHLACLVAMLALSGCLDSDQYQDRDTTGTDDVLLDTTTDHSPPPSDWTGEGSGDWTGDWTGDTPPPDTTPDTTPDVVPDTTDTTPDVCVPADLTECEVTFNVPVTSPVAQEYVWLTGSFTGWATTLEGGAIALGQEGGEWMVDVLLEDAQTLEYKYLIKWPDGGQQWCVLNFDRSFDCAPSAPNLQQAVECGQTDCGVVVTPTCDDGLKNQGEEKTDCGGPCPACPVEQKDYDWRDAILYFVFVDRFFDGDASNNSTVAGVDAPANYQGGDLKGVQAKLDYLADLGVNAIWITAPYDNRNSKGHGMGSDSHDYSGFHGYWPSPAVSGLKVEPRIGDGAALKSLVDAAHAKGMKVVFDYVMNHVDNESGLYNAHKDWFHPYKDCQSSGWGVDCWFTDYLPDFDFDNAAARAWSVNDALAWAGEYDVDGFRLDAIKHVENSWLTDLRAGLNAQFPQKAFYLVGETFEYNNCQYIQSFVNPDTKLDGQFDFPLRARLAKKVLLRQEKLGDLNGDLDWLQGCYPGAVMSTFIGNHDLPRAIHVADGKFGDQDSGGWSKGWTPGDYPTVTSAGPYRRLGLAYAVLLTLPGVPLIYYGDEIGLAGGADPDNRRMMTFSGWNPNQQWLHDRIKKLNAIRTDHPVLRYGQRTGFHFGWDSYGYKMSATYETLYVLLNRADNADQVSGVPDGAYTDLISGGNLTVTGGKVSVPGQDAMILVAAE